MVFKYRSSLLAGSLYGFSALLLASCGSNSFSTNDPYRMMNQVKAKQASCVLQWDSASPVPSPQTLNQLRMCLDAVTTPLVTYYQVLLPQTLQQSACAELYALNLYKEIQRLKQAKPHQFSWDYQADPSEASQPLTVEIRLKKYVAYPPTASQDPFVLGDAYCDPWPHLGWSTHANLGSMVHDARDLAIGKAEGNPPASLIQISVDSLYVKESAGGGSGGAGSGSAGSGSGSMPPGMGGSGSGVGSGR